MRLLDATTKKSVQAVIDANRAQLSQVPGFVSAEYYDGQPFVVSFFGDEGAAMQWLQARPADAPLA